MTTVKFLHGKGAARVKYGNMSDFQRVKASVRERCVTSSCMCDSFTAGVVRDDLAGNMSRGIKMKVDGRELKLMTDETEGKL